MHTMAVALAAVAAAFTITIHTTTTLATTLCSTTAATLCTLECWQQSITKHATPTLEALSTLHTTAAPHYNCTL
jgi:hypothetical protein